LNPVIKVQVGFSSASAFPRQPSAPLCFCTTKNPTHVINKLRHFLILNEKFALAPAMFLYTVACYQCYISKNMAGARQFLNKISTFWNYILEPCY